MDSLARRAADPRTRNTKAGARSVLSVIFLQTLILIVAPYHPTGAVPPPCLTLFDFLAGDNFNLSPAYAARLRAVLLPFICALPYPYPTEPEATAQRSTQPHRPRAAARLGSRPVPPVREPARMPREATPTHHRAATGPPTRLRKNTLSLPAPSRAHFVPVS